MTILVITLTFVATVCIGSMVIIMKEHRRLQKLNKAVQQLLDDNLCPYGHPADGAPCVSYKCERIDEDPDQAWSPTSGPNSWMR